MRKKKKKKKTTSKSRDKEKEKRHTIIQGSGIDRARAINDQIPPDAAIHRGSSSTTTTSSGGGGGVGRVIHGSGPGNDGAKALRWPWGEKGGGEGRRVSETRRESIKALRETGVV